jgi:uncharacterized protein YegP (UPF0339 family)
MKPHIKIVDSFVRPFRGQGSARKVKGYRVQLIAGNGEILQHSEQLESVKAVKKHIEALGKVFAITAAWELYSIVKIDDVTKEKVWPNPFVK